jgi:hypothetical protein
VKITISLQEKRGGVIWDEYALDGNGKELGFPTVKAAVNYLADRNWTIADLREINFNMEEAGE